MAEHPMLNRIFAIALLERCYAINGLLNNSLFVLKASENLQAQHPSACRAIGWLFGDIGDLLLEPTWREYPDLQSLYFNEPHSSEPQATWATFRPKSRLVPREQISSADFHEISRDTALRLFTIFESCYWNLNFIYESAKNHAIPELPILKLSLQYIAGSLFSLLLIPLQQAHPGIALGNISKGWPIKPKALTGKP
jgi:hypothetical protein